MKKLFVLVLAILTFLTFLSPVLAQETNKFGIHILEPSEVFQAAKLVNSQGGDWGWVTIVLRINDLDQQKWQNFFNDCRRLHLIPLVRLATEMENENWRKPTLTDIDKMAEFLAGLNWPIKNQYIIVFNETNHAKEWGGEINPAEYAQILNYTIDKFKEKDQNFKILNGGFDLAADNSSGTMDTYRYWQIMNQAVPQIFNRLDVWSSHPYPNPGFIGKPTDQGRRSIVGYRWEITTLKNSFGVTKDLPVFITETGWPRNNSKLGTKSSSFYDPETVAEYTEAALGIWLADPQIQAITPFVLNYHAPPLDVFSWLDQEGRDHPHSRKMREMPKTAWWPEQISAWKIEAVDLPKFLPVNSKYQGKIILRNVGQSIWGEKEFSFNSISSQVDNIVLPKEKRIEPGQTYQFTFNIRGSNQAEIITIAWENLETEAAVNFFNPASLASYQKNFWQKIISLIRVWWYEKAPREDYYYQKEKQ